MENYHGTYLALLEFPEEHEADPNLEWLKNSRGGVVQLCNEFCVKVGPLYIVPSPYFAAVDRFLQKIERDYQSKGYHPLFKVVKVIFSKIEFTRLQRWILESTFYTLEDCLTKLEEAKLDQVQVGMVQQVSRHLMKAQESVVLFQLEREFPEQLHKLHDLINILTERIAFQEAPIVGPVVVTEIESKN